MNWGELIDQQWLETCELELRHAQEQLKWHQENYPDNARREERLYRMYVTAAEHKLASARRSL